MQLIKIVKKDTYKGSKTHISYYALQLENGNIVPIKPIYNNGYRALELMRDKTIFEGVKNGD
jgi:hypothetical protein